MTACVRILSTSSVDSSPSILLVNADGTKILVDSGEGCQRCFLEHGQKVSTVRAVCLTHLSHTSIGGLPGLILTSADVQASSSGSEYQRSQPDQSAEDEGKNGSNGDIPLSPNIEQPQQRTWRGLDLIGPTGTQAFVNSLSHFMNRDRFQLRVSEGGSQTILADSHGNNIKNRKRRKKPSASAVACGFTVTSLSFLDEEDDDDESNSNSNNRPHGRKRSHSPSNADDKPQQKKRQQQPEPRRRTLSFLFTTQPMPGKFLPQKAAELGVPKGPMYGTLKSGRVVTFVREGGEELTVQPEQVMEPSTPGVAVLVLYYEEAEHGRKILGSKSFARLLDNRDVRLDIVLHMTPDPSLISSFKTHFEKQNLDLQNEKEHLLIEHVWVATGNNIPNTDTFSLQHDVEGTPFRSAAVGAVARSLVCDDIYRVPSHINHSCSQCVPAASSSCYRFGRTMMEYTLIPRSRRGFAEEGLPPIDHNEALKLANKTGAIKLGQEILRSINQSTTPQNVANGELVFTGTGSAVPCKYRNVTGMSLVAKNGNSMLLDAGEGTVGQLLRVHSNGSESTKSTLSRIKSVWISHPHADHHLGILRLLHDREAADPVQVIAPNPIFRFLEDYAAVIDPTIRGRYVTVNCYDLSADQECVRPDRRATANDHIRKSFGWDRIRTVPVLHCAYASAMIVDGTTFGRVVYSGDCRPSNRLADTARPVDLLIHEATFEDGMEAEATLKYHSTVGEALSVARRMQARYTVLTHFSQRYPKVPPTTQEDDTNNVSTASGTDRLPVIFAFDAMRLTPTTLLAASKLTPALRLLYPDDDEEEEDGDIAGSSSKEKDEAIALLSTPGIFAQSGILRHA